VKKYFLIAAFVLLPSLVYAVALSDAAMIALSAAGVIVAAASGIGPAFLGSLALHAAVLSIVFGGSATQPITATTVQGMFGNPDTPLQVMIEPAAKLPIPLNDHRGTWTNDPGSNPQPMPPPSYPADTVYSFDNLSTTDGAVGSGATQDAAFANWIVVYNAHWQGLATGSKAYIDTASLSGAVGSKRATYTRHYQTTQAGSPPYATYYTTVYNNQFGFGVTNTCAMDPGYTQSGANCVLTDRTQVQKPAGTICSILRSGNTFQADPQNTSGCSLPSMTHNGVTYNITSDTISQAKPDGTTQTVKVNADGTVTHSVDVPNVQNGTTTRGVNTYGVPPGTGAGAPLDGTTVGTIDGTGTGAGTTPNISINLPTDYARQGEAAAAATSINDTLGPKLDALDICTTHPDSIICQGNGTAPDLPTDELQNNDVAVDVSPVGGFDLVGSCPAPMHITVGGHDELYDYSLICTYASDLRPIIVLFASLIAAGILIGGFKNG